jgi:hypothetical protein
MLLLAIVLQADRERYNRQLAEFDGSRAAAAASVAPTGPAAGHSVWEANSFCNEVGGQGWV